MSIIEANAELPSDARDVALRPQAEREDWSADLGVGGDEEGILAGDGAEATHGSDRVRSGRREHLGRVSGRILLETRDIANEGDRWFLATLRGVDRGLTWTTGSMAKVGGRALTRIATLKAELSRESTKDRMRAALLREARCVALDPAEAEVQVFADNIATLIQLVYEGRIRFADVAFGFEDTEESQPADDQATATALGALP